MSNLYITSLFNEKFYLVIKYGDTSKRVSFFLILLKGQIWKRVCIIYSNILGLKGHGEQWNVTDYQFAWVSDKGAVSDSKTVTYLGYPKDLSGEIIVEIYDYFKDGSVPHQTYITQSENLNASSFLTGGSGAYLDNNLSVEDIVKNTYFLIRWTTKDMKQHEEKIQMEMDYNPQILSHIKR